MPQGSKPMVREQNAEAFADERFKLGAADAAKSLADEIGENADRIQVVDPRWGRFLQQGVTVAVTIRRWRAEVTMTLADLGIEPSNPQERKALQRLLRIGSRYLLPLEVIKKLERLDNRSRYLLKTYSFNTFWGHWVPARRYAEWKAADEQIEAAYFALASDIYENWDRYVAQVKVDYVSLGNQAFGRLFAAGRIAYDPGESLSLLKGRWVNEFVERAMLRMPTKEQARAQFGWERTVKFLPMADQLERDRLSAQSERMKMEARYRAQAESAMLLDVRKTQIREQAEGLQRFVADVQAQVRNEVYDAALNGLEALEKGQGSLDRNTTRGLKNLVKMVNDMVFWDDPDLQTRIADLEYLTNVPSERRSERDVKDALQSLGRESRLVLLELDRAPSRSGKLLGIPDDVAQLAGVVGRAPRQARPDGPIQGGDGASAEFLPRRRGRGDGRRDGLL